MKPLKRLKPKPHMADLFLLPLIQIALLLTLPRDPFLLIGTLALLFILPEPYLEMFKDYLSKRKHLRFKTLKRDDLDFIVVRHSEALYLGQGFEFMPQHTSKLMRVLSKDRDNLRGCGHSHGSIAIHNVKRSFNYDPLLQDLTDLNSHTLIFGTTGAGKTRMLDLLASQAVMRGDTVIVLDPKGDLDLRDNLYKACLINRRQKVFRLFDLGNVASDKCSRFNVLGSFDNVTEISSRIASLMSAAGSGENFKSHALNALTSSLIALKLDHELKELDKKQKAHSSSKSSLHTSSASALNPRNIKCDDDLIFKHPCNYGITLASIRDVLSDFDSFKRILLRYFLKQVQDSGDDELIQSFTSMPYKCRASIAPLKELYHTLLDKRILKESNADLDLLFSTANLDKTFYGKVTAGILPKLNSLSAGDLKKALSPDMGISFDSIIKENGVFYVSLRTLVDSETGANLGKLMLADLCAVAGKIYKEDDISSIHTRDYDHERYQKAQAFSQLNTPKQDKKRVCIFIDEASEILCESMVQLANKSRGAGFALTLVTQTIADFIKHGGSKADAEQIIANANTLISMRIKDGETCDAVIKRMPRIYVEERTTTRSFSRLSDRYHISKSAIEREVPLIPASALELLPDLEYIATLADGRVIKGLIPFLIDEDPQNEQQNEQQDEQNSAASGCSKPKRGYIKRHEAQLYSSSPLSFLDELKDCLQILKQDLKQTALLQRLMKRIDNHTKANNTHKFKQKDPIYKH